jgi:hypothetical protein
LIQRLSDFRHPLETRLVNQKIAEQDVILEVDRQSKPRQYIFVRLIQLPKYNKQINI